MLGILLSHLAWLIINMISPKTTTTLTSDAEDDQHSTRNPEDEHIASKDGNEEGEVKESNLLSLASPQNIVDEDNSSPKTPSEGADGPAKFTTSPPLDKPSVTDAPNTTQDFRVSMRSIKRPTISASHESYSAVSMPIAVRRSHVSFLIF